MYDEKEEMQAAFQEACQIRKEDFELDMVGFAARLADEIYDAEDFEEALNMLIEVVGIVGKRIERRLKELLAIRMEKLDRLQDKYLAKYGPLE